MKTENLQELGQWKVGMDVLVENSDTTQFIRKISRITSGRGGTVYIVSSPNLLGKTFEIPFDIDGHERGGDVWHKKRITPATDEMKNKVAMKQRMNRLSEFNFNSISLEQASEIVLFMREKGIKI